MAITYEAVPANEYVSHIDVEQLGNQTLFSVVSGCTVSESAVDMVVTVASGVVLVDGASVTVAGGTLTLVSDPSNKRWCYATVNAAGAATVVVGDAATSGAVEPTKPDPSGKVILKMYKVEAGQTIAANVSVAPNKRILSETTVASVLTTTGDMLYASAPNTPARLAAAADGYVLTATGAGAAPAWEAPSGTEIGQSIYAAIAGGDTYLTSGGWLKADASIVLQSAYATLFTRVGILGAGYTQWTDRNSAAGSPAILIRDVAAGASSRMLAVGDSGYIHTSTDGGATWVDRNGAAGTPSGGITGYYTCAIGPNASLLMYAATYNYVRVSTTGGVSWVDRTVASGIGAAYIEGSAIGPSDQMLAVGYRYIRTSTDNGATWVDRVTAAGAGAAQLKGCAIGPSGEMIAVGATGYVRTSTDAGVTWVDRKTAAGSGSLTMYDAAIGPSGEMLVVGGNGYIRTSTDGGATWVDRNTASGLGGGDAYSCTIGPTGNMLAVGATGYVRASTDGGGTWTDINSNTGAGTTLLYGASTGPGGESIIGGNTGFIRTNESYVYDTATEFALPNLPAIDSQQAYIKAT